MVAFVFAFAFLCPLLFAWFQDPQVAAAWQSCRMIRLGHGQEQLLHLSFEWMHAMIWSPSLLEACRDAFVPDFLRIVPCASFRFRE